MRLLTIALLLLASSSLVCGFRFRHSGATERIPDLLKSIVDKIKAEQPNVAPTIAEPTQPVTPTNTSDIEFPGRLLQSLKLDADQTARTVLESIDRASIVHQISQVVLPSQDEGCCECVGKTAHHIIDETYNAVQTACQNVSCPVIKAECQWIEDHEERYKGYLVARIRPAGLGFSYCMGTQECKHPNYTAISNLLITPAFTSDETYLPLQADEFLGKFLSYSMQNASTWKGLFDDQKTKLAEDMTTDDKEGRHKCMRYVVKTIMKHVGKHLKHVCETTKCPKMQKFCAWAKDHKDTVRGYIYGKIEPWKFAVGFCAARRHQDMSLE